VNIDKEGGNILSNNYDFITDKEEYSEMLLKG
jgi:hypothetical protein